MLGKPLLGGQVYDTLRALDYLRSRPDVGGAVSLVGDGPHGVIALYAAALDARVRGVALRQTVTDYRSLAVAERYTQPFGIYAYGILREFDLPDVARAVGPRPVLAAQPRDAARRAGRRGGSGSLQEVFRTSPFGRWTPATIRCRFWPTGRPGADVYSRLRQAPAEVEPPPGAHFIHTGSSRSEVLGLKSLADENFLEPQDLLSCQFGSESLLDRGQQCLRFLH